MSGTEQSFLFIPGCVGLVIGICLAAWRAVQMGQPPRFSRGHIGRAARAGPGVNAFARYIPDQAARLGWLLIVVRLVLIFRPFYLPERA